MPRRYHRLGHQHLKAAVGRDAQLLRPQDQLGAEGVVHHVQHRLQVGESAQVDQAAAVVGVHAGGAGVDDDLPLAGGLGLGVGNGAVAAGAADGDDARRAAVAGHGGHRVAGAAAAQDQHRLAPEPHAVPPGQVLEPVVVGVEAQQLAAPVDQRVHRADGRRPGLDLVAVWDDQLFVGDGHVDPLKVPRLQKSAGVRLGGQLVQLVGIAADLLVDLAGVAVPQFFADQAVFHGILLLDGLYAAGRGRPAA